MKKSKKEIVIGIKTDTSDVDKGIKDVKDKIDSVNNSTVDKPFKALKTQIKEATLEAQKMAEQFGKNSTEFTTAAKKVAELRDRFNETNQAVQAFNPDNKLQALVGVARGAIGALQGVSGAMAFLGVESGTAQETLAKLQGLMAFSSALDSIDDIKNSFRNFNSVISSSTVLQKANAIANTVTAATMKTLGISVASTSAGFKALKVAIISTGIGALVIGITALITKISEWTDGTDDAKEAQDQLASAIENVNKQLNNQLEDIDFESKKEILIAKQAGATKGQLFDLETKALEKRTQAYQENYDKQSQINSEALRKFRSNSEEDTAERKKAQDAFDEASKKLTQSRQAQETSSLTHGVELRDEERQKRKEIGEKRLQDSKAAIEKEKQQFEEEKKNLEQHLKELEELNKETVKSIAERGLSERDKELKELKDGYRDKVAFLESTRTEELALLDKSLKKGKITTEKYEADKIEIEKKYKDIGIDLSVDYQGKRFDIEKKYNDSIKEFIIKETQSEFAIKRKAIEASYDEMLKVAEGKDKELLEKLKADALKNADSQETTRVASIQAETTQVTTKVENRILDSDTPEERRAKIEAVYAVDVELENAQFALKLETLKGQDAEIELAKAEHNAKLTELADQQAKDEKAIDEAKKIAKLNNLDTLSNALTNAGTLFEKNSVAGKAISVATATIDTYTGATKALAAYPPPFNYVAAAGVIAAGFANVKKILSTKIGKSDNGNGSANAPTTGTAPVINSTQLNPNAQVQDVRVTNQQDQVVKAYVPLDDLRTAEQKQNFFNNLTTF